MSNDKNTITAFKGFDKDLKCRDFQYELGGTYTHEGDVEPCRSGFHAVTFPLDALSYYAQADGGRYCEVALVDPKGEKGGDSKVVSKEITVGAEIGLPGLIKAQVKAVWDIASAKGAKEDGHSAANGNYGHSAANGNYGHSAANGYRGHSAANGYRGHSAANGNYGVASALGIGGRAKASKTGAIVLAHWVDGRLAGIKSSLVGENGIKPDTWYCLDGDGNFAEVD